MTPELLKIGPLTIRWYGITAALGLAVAFWYIKKLASWLKITIPLDNLFFLIAFFGLIGARVYHILNELPFYVHRPELIPAVWKGGLAIHGGIIAGVIVLMIWCYKHRTSFWQIADIFMPALLLGQAIGRLGNYFNQELFGKPTSLPWGVFIDANNRPEMYKTITHFHPTFLYECLWNILAVIVITWWIKKVPPKNTGIIFSVSLIAGGIGRFFVELLRIDQTPLIIGIRLPLIVSILLIIVGVIIFSQRKRLSQ